MKLRYTRKTARLPKKARIAISGFSNGEPPAPPCKEGEKRNKPTDFWVLGIKNNCEFCKQKLINVHTPSLSPTTVRAR